MQCSSVKYEPYFFSHPDNDPLALNIVTPVTRLTNLKTIKESLNMRCDVPGVTVCWHPIIDASVTDIAESFLKELETGFCLSNMSGIAGHVHRNTLLMIKEVGQRFQGSNVGREWIMSLDDDNILHPDLIPWLSLHRQELHRYSGIIFDQVFKNGVTRLRADPDKVTVGNIDTAQYMFRTSIVQGLRFDETRYDADGVFIEELYRRHKDKFLFVNQPLCYYNYLRS